MTEQKHDDAGGASRSDAGSSATHETNPTQKCGVNGVLPMGVFMCRHHGFNNTCHYNYRCEHQVVPNV